MTTEKEKRIIALNKEGKTSREISKQTRSSFSTISKVLRKAEDEEKSLVQKKTILEEDNQADARYTQVIKMLSMGKSAIDIAKKITGIKADEILSIKAHYYKLKDADELAQIYADFRAYLSSILSLYKRMRQENIKQEDLIYSLKNFKNLRILNDKILSAGDQLERMKASLAETRKAVYSLMHQKRKLESTIRSYQSKELSYRKKFKSFREYEALEEEFERHSKNSNDI